MKKIKVSLAAVALVLFTACYNPNSSTSQERGDDTEMNEHAGGHGHEGAAHGTEHVADTTAAHDSAHHEVAAPHAAGAEGAKETSH